MATDTQTTQTKTKLTSKAAILQVLGCLLKNPLLLRSNDYKLELNDFTEQFHRILFGAIEHLAAQGLSTITYIDVDQFLVEYGVQYKVFTDNKGIEYVIKATELAEDQNFGYYYNTLKKISLLNQLSDDGFDITPIFDDSIIDPIAAAKMQSKFDNMTVYDILNYFDCKLASLKDTYAKNHNTVQALGSEGIRSVKEKFKEVPEMGLPLMSPKMTTVYRGQRLKKIYLESSAQGVGKSRRMAGESVHLAVPKYFDIEKNRWVCTNLQEHVLYISTELELEEVQTMWLACISGVKEQNILNGRYEPGEEARVDQAIELLENSHLYFVQISNYDMDDIEAVIKKYYQLHQVNYVYYDYLSTTIKIMSEGASKSKVSNLREDQILLMFSTRLKDLANELDIFIWTATQLSGEWKSAKEPDQQLLRGAKSISDKVDIGSIMLPIRDADADVINSVVTKGFAVQPTHVIHIYKVRRGNYNNIRLYINFDRALCRVQDCFATDSSGKLLNIEDTNIETILDKTSAESNPFDVGFDF